VSATAVVFGRIDWPTKLKARLLIGLFVGERIAVQGRFIDWREMRASVYLEKDVVQCPCDG
jgi:hypothetical protein